MLISLGPDGLPGYELKIITDLIEDGKLTSPDKWIAYREGTDSTDEDQPIGRGRSEGEAIMDLMDVEAWRRGE